jgi:predicted nucleic acid-binding protein
MKLLMDSSIIYSALVYSGKVLNLLDILIEKHTIVLSDYIIEELKRNIRNKLSNKNKTKALKQLKNLISNCEIKKKNEYIHNLPKAMKLISGKDAPILACGMLPDIDYLVSSDKEFWNVHTLEISILSPKEAREKLL